MGDVFANLDDLLHAANQRRPPEKPKPLPEAQVMELQSICEKYRKQRFQPGDLVVVRRGGCCNDPDQPHIVLEVRSEAEPDWTSDPSSQLFGARYDVRIASLYQGIYGAFWAESWYFEPYEAAA